MYGTKFQNNQYIANFAEMPDNRLVYTNKVFINQEHFEAMKRQYGSEPVYVQCKDFVYTLSGHDKVTTGVVLNRKQREECKISKMEKICLQLFEVPPDFQILTISASVEPVKMPSSKIQIQEAEIEKQLKEQFLRFAMNEGQSFILDFQLEDQGSFPIIINVQEIKLMDLGTKKSSNQIQGKGMINHETQLLLTAVPNKNIQVKSLKMKTVSMFKGTSFNFEELGVGGLDSEITEIFRRAFASRLLPPAALEKLGIQHVKGMLLYGPPGTGKTLIARSLAKCLHAHEPKIINGPEVFNKYVGQTEQNIRDLFVQAESEYNEKGDESKLHVIIFDEIDAICRPRGTISSGTGVHDTVVNQLLSKIDGVNALNNILVIGMTNRKDMIDEAVLRPGRLEVHIEIGLPNEAGRIQIFNIHTKQLRMNNVLDRSVNIQKLAQSTKNFSGAEIEAVVKSAASYAFTREVDIHNLSKELNIDNIRVTQEDFEQALKEIHPQFGIDKDYIETCIRGGIIDYGQNFKYITERLYKMINQVQSSTKTPLLSVLLEGPSGVGKTALAAYVALSSGFPFIKLVSPENFIDYTENGKIREINKIFNDAYKSPLSIIVLDNLERLIEFVNLGPRFSNSILQALIVLIKKQPPKEDRRVLIIGTCTNSTLLEDLELSPAFQQTISIPKLQQEEMKSVIQQQYNVKPQELETIGNMLKPLPIKQLLLGCERAMQGQKYLTSQAITESFGFEQIQNY